MNPAELFADAYAETHMAADEASKLAVHLENQPMTFPQVRQWREHLTAATSAVIALEERVKGNPEPKRGE